MFDRMLPKLKAYINLSSIFLCFCFAISSAHAQTFSKLTLNEDEYILVDVVLRDWTLLTDIEIYQLDNNLYVPYLTVIEALELKHNSRLDSNYFQVTVGDNSNWLDLIKNQTNLRFASGESLTWASNEYDRLLSLDMFSALLDSSIVYDSSQLRVVITPREQGYLFPVEKRMNRSQEEKRIRRTTINQEEFRYFSSEEVLVDHYHFITPPTGSVNLAVYDGKNQNLNYSVGASLSGDFLYHSAILNLSKGKNSDLLGYLRFSGAPTSPYELLPLGITRYDFGDVSASNTGGSAGGSGVGFTFRSDEKDFSRDFGSTVIEGLSVPGWEAELYIDGYFIAQQKVSDQGIYKFENINTEYGVNTFIVKLYGPHGEEEERIETLNISGNWLKPGKSRFKGSVLESNSRLLHGALDGGYSPDKLNYGWDYGISDKYQTGLTLSAQKDDDGSYQKELNINLQAAFKDLLIKNELLFEDGGDIRANINGQGLISKRHTYSFRYNYSQINTDNGQEQNKFNTHGLSFNLSGWNKFIIPLNYSFGANFVSSKEKTELTRVNSRLSWAIGGVNLYNNLTYIPQDEDSYYRGNLGWSTKLYDSRISMETSYIHKDNTELDTARISFYTDFDNGYSLNGRAEYYNELEQNGISTVINEDRWNLSTSVSKAFDNFQVSGVFQHDSTNNWSIGLGINFALGYDHVNNQFKVSNGGIYGGATLDLTAYLDRNSNNILDENDLALPGVEFGPYNNWREYKTGKTGRVVLQGVPTNSTVGFSGAWKEGVLPSVSSYSLYTHSGGYIKANIPFTIKTDVVGYLFMAIEESEQAVKEAQIELVDPNGKLIASTVTSHDGYYEFNEVNSGDYHIRVNQDFLALRGLKSQPGVYHLATPPQGGFVEIQALTLYPKNKVVYVDEVKDVEFNDENYDPAIGKVQAGKGVYIKTEKKRFKNVKSNIKPVILKSASIIKPKLASIKKIEKVLVTASPELIIENTSKVKAKQPEPEIVSPKKVEPSGWVLQFGSYKKSDNAKSDLAALSVKLPEEELSIVEHQGLFKVVLAGFSSFSEASAKGNHLQIKKEIPSFPVRIKKPNSVHSENEFQSKVLPKFTIQLAAVKDSKLASGVIKELPQEYQYYTAKHNDNNLVLLELFENRDEAITLLGKLQENDKIKGWVRSLSDVNNIKTFTKI
ncbi:SPOR domain-containing protein [Pseudoalteromonas denitrificans]|uniref:SPOR domain-containing protein n=1 Tax=Pseudoalteromonas denitrificans DSM 6059 TaxID=1123010 RepID=A0A1I1HPM6_9GAMM|nr:SPOR domain-containing protein [Pseudoalteromonas denitrificans]SFC25806.1 hypothetical protein SAMN02745724_01286 [Pseudoalteromonas denitrificans DSM 6059]